MKRFLCSVVCIRAFRLSLALGATTLALPLFAETVHAACNDSDNPPPAPSASLNVSGRHDPIVEISLGEEGCDGRDGESDRSGDPGFPAQASGDVTVTVSSGAITGQSPETEAAVSAISLGGVGGEGGRSGANIFGDLHGGLGGMGGDAGTVRLNFDGTIDGSPGFGLLLRSNGGGLIANTGGHGGSGGLAEGGVGGAFGGPGGIGGSAGSIIVTSSGSITADVILLATAHGADGGKGGKGGGGVGFSRGGDGGAGGTGGSVTVGVAGTMIAVQDAVVADSTGGRGGDGGEAAFQTASEAGSGGVGGAGGTVRITADDHVTSRSGTALAAWSSGGEGGKGGKATALADAKAGRGGKGGTGGSAHITVMSGAVVRTEATGGGGLRVIRVTPGSWYSRTAVPVVRAAARAPSSARPAAAALAARAAPLRRPSTVSS